MSPESIDEASSSQVLGYLSIASGLAMVCAPTVMARAYGLPRRPMLVRLLGARDVLIGVGLVSETGRRVGRLARAASDSVDVSLIASRSLRSEQHPAITFARVLGGLGLVAWSARYSKDASRPRTVRF
jgi:hypothetical protein